MKDESLTLLLDLLESIDYNNELTDTDVMLIGFLAQGVRDDHNIGFAKTDREFWDGMKHRLERHDAVVERAFEYMNGLLAKRAERKDA